MSFLVVKVGSRSLSGQLPQTCVSSSSSSSTAIVGRLSRSVPRQKWIELQRRKLSTSTTTAEELAENVEERTADDLIEGSTTENLGSVVRHGRGDAHIILNIGGTEFQTLRSTVNSNPVLADHVARALKNKETTMAGAIFIDRDPTHFGFILQYLRNRADMLSYTNSPFSALSMKKFTETYVDLPQDRKVMRDLYLEATYYRLPELQEALTRTGWLVNIMDLLTNSGNPFDAAAKWMARLRNFAVLFATFGTLGTTSLIAIKHDFEEMASNVGQKLGITKKEEEVKKDESGGIFEAVGLRKKEIKEEIKHQHGLEEVLREAATALEKS
jgi:hypothetical protein